MLLISFVQLFYHEGMKRTKYFGVRIIDIRVRDPDIYRYSITPS
jgi:hypothetical protein